MLSYNSANQTQFCIKKCGTGWEKYVVSAEIQVNCKSEIYYLSDVWPIAGCGRVPFAVDLVATTHASFTPRHYTLKDLTQQVGCGQRSLAIWPWTTPHHHLTGSGESRPVSPAPISSRANALYHLPGDTAPTEPGLHRLSPGRRWSALARCCYPSDI
ncbi:unnamed protein product [Pleuronectes platessa]|uniref:Uncharacterized protein n=1 Tax=Pleuronectes platessa TaxID=8262 RepID=A0A9N7Y3N5_PLEPL|nr:unnamed protein product [Pleuronectes platessa]